VLFQQTYKLHPFEPGETYFGDKLNRAWQVSIYQSTMGNVLEECNFTVFLERLGGLSETVHVHRVGFSGDGWYEFVAIHESDEAAIVKAREMLDLLKDYPILDDDRFTQAEDDYFTSLGYVQNHSGEWAPGPAH
jgi:hypothetical protein